MKQEFQIGDKVYILIHNNNIIENYNYLNNYKSQKLQLSLLILQLMVIP